MKKSLTMLATLLLAGTVAFGQAGQPGAQPGQTPGQTPNMDQQSVRGCLSGSEGNYRLMTEQGTTYQLKGSEENLREHVGKEVEISTDSAGMSDSQGAAGQGGAQAGAASQQTLQVQEVTQISETCQSGAGAGAGAGGASDQPGQTPQTPQQ